MNKPTPSTSAYKGKDVSLMHLENRIKRVRLLTEQAKLEEGRRGTKSSHHASQEEKVESRPFRPTRPITEEGRKKELRTDRSTSANIQPSTSKEPGKGEERRKSRKAPERQSTAKSREMNRDKQANSPYAKRNGVSPTSSTESIQRLMDEVKRLKEENNTLRSKVEVDLTNSQDLHEWPRKDLLKLIAQLESKEVRKPVQAAVKKLQEMGDTITLHDQLKLARETVENLKQQNANLQEQLTAAKSTPTPPPSAPTLPASIHQGPTVPRLDMDWLHNSTDSPEPNGTDNNGDLIDDDEHEQNGHAMEGELTEKDLAGVVTDPALMPRWEYEHIACDIVHATRAAILRKRFIERLKKEREKDKEMILSTK